MFKKITSFALKKNIARLELQKLVRKLKVSNFVKLPDVHKGAALIMLIHFILQPLMWNIFVIEGFKFSLPKLFNGIPLLNRIDLSYVSFLDGEFIIERFNSSVLILLPLLLPAVVISQWLMRRTAPKQLVQLVEQSNIQKDYIDGLDDLNRKSCRYGIGR